MKKNLKELKNKILARLFFEEYTDLQATMMKGVLKSKNLPPGFICGNYWFSFEYRCERLYEYKDAYIDVGIPIEEYNELVHEIEVFEKKYKPIPAEIELQLVRYESIEEELGKDNMETAKIDYETYGDVIFALELLKHVATKHPEFEDFLMKKVDTLQKLLDNNDANCDCKMCQKST